MNSKMHIGVILILTVFLTSFIFFGIAFTPLLRISVGRFLLSYSGQDKTFLNNQTANVLSPSTPVGTTATSTKVATGTSTTDIVNADSQSKVYEYKLVRTVDGCKLNTLGAQGFQAIQYGPAGVNPDAGRDSDCKSFHVVDSFDWILFMREK